MSYWCIVGRIKSNHLNNRMNRILPVIIVIIAIMLAVWFVIVRSSVPTIPLPGNLISSVSYTCDESKTIEASYYDGATGAGEVESSGGGTVVIILSDGRSITLARTVSADGTRYSNTDESFIFWSKGEGAFVSENNQQTYANCVDSSKGSSVISMRYVNPVRGFALQVPHVATSSAEQYPDAFGLDESYQYDALGPAKTITGVKFTVPIKVAVGTNLGSDSYLSVEQIPNVTSCSAVSFMQSGVKAQIVNDRDIVYSVASTSGAAAGNRYEETVYAIASSSPCTAVRYFVHYGVFENYATGSVRQFDKDTLLDTFDAVRRTVVLQ